MLAEQIVNRFRVVSLERLARLEAHWAKAVVDPSDSEATAAMHREVHTLKGDARMVGFGDVDLVCHKLEDMLELARERSYSVSDDFELIVIMAVQLVGMLIRKRAGSSFGGIDLPGFIRQMDAIVADTRREQTPRVRTTTAPTLRVEADRERDVLTPATRASLSNTALELFLESAANTSRTKRVARGWGALRELLALPALLPIAPILLKHGGGVAELAHELGKDIGVRFEIPSELKTEPTVCAALDVATLHLIRNAADHGIETAAARVARGKPPHGTITVTCSAEADVVRLDVSDDGAGIDFAEVRRRGIALGLLPANTQFTEAQLADVLWKAGFSTRTVTTEVSGRGIGLDAVGAAVAAVGGTCTVSSVHGTGTTWSVSIPAPSRKVAAMGFSVPGSALRFAIATDWAIEIVADAPHVIDLAEVFGLADEPAPRGPRVKLRVRRGDLALDVVAAWNPVPVTVRRLLVTPPDANAEVVLIDGFEALLVRPDRLIQGTGKVAIVDDSEICREMMKASLEPFGIEVLAIEDPTTLIATLALSSVDMILLDLSFERLDIGELIRRIRGAIPNLPVYLHSDRPISELQRIAETTRADGYLSKTADADQIVQRVSRVLRSRRSEH